MEADLLLELSVFLHFYRENVPRLIIYMLCIITGKYNDKCPKVLKLTIQWTALYEIWRNKLTNSTIFAMYALDIQRWQYFDNVLRNIIMKVRNDLPIVLKYKFSI